MHERFGISRVAGLAMDLLKSGARRRPPPVAPRSLEVLVACFSSLFRGVTQPLGLPWCAARVVHTEMPLGVRKRPAAPAVSRKRPATERSREERVAQRFSSILHGFSWFLILFFLFFVVFPLFFNVFQGFSRGFQGYFTRRRPKNPRFGWR